MFLAKGLTRPGHTQVRASLQWLVMDVLMRRRDEALEQRMRLMRLAQEFWMELAGEEERMPGQFDHFDEFAVLDQSDFDARWRRIENEFFFHDKL